MFIPFCETPYDEVMKKALYVAITRARERLYLTSANMRYKFGDATFAEPSRFIQEIDPKYLICDNTEKTDLSKLTFNNRHVEKPILSLRHNVLTEKKQKPQLRLSNSSPAIKNRTGLNLKPKQEPSDSQWRLADIKEIELGQTVRHSKFGIGIVLHTEVIGGDKRAKVDFGSQGERVLILKFAKLQVRK